jgi:hypothetical protein
MFLRLAARVSERSALDCVWKERSTWDAERVLESEPSLVGKKL